MARVWARHSEMACCYVRNGHGASRWVLGNKPQSVGTAGYRQLDAERVGRLLWMQLS